MLQAMNQGSIDRARNDASDGSGSDGCCERCIMERRIVQSMDQKVIGGAMDGASNGS